MRQEGGNPRQRRKIVAGPQNHRLRWAGSRGLQEWRHAGRYCAPDASDSSSGSDGSERAETEDADSTETSSHKGRAWEEAP